MTIRSIMKKDYLFVYETDPIEVVLQMMKTNKINSVPVLNQNKALTGIVVKADIYRFMIQPGHYDSCPVDWVMSKDVVSILPEVTVEEASKKLLDKNIVSMPVVENNTLIGMIHMEELLAYYIGRK